MCWKINMPETIIHHIYQRQSFNIVYMGPLLICVINSLNLHSFKWNVQFLNLYSISHLPFTKLDAGLSIFSPVESKSFLFTLVNWNTPMQCPTAFLHTETKVPRAGHGLMVRQHDRPAHCPPLRGCCMPTPVRPQPVALICSMSTRSLSPFVPYPLSNRGKSPRKKKFKKRNKCSSLLTGVITKTNKKNPILFDRGRWGK